MAGFVGSSCGGWRVLDRSSTRVCKTAREISRGSGAARRSSVRMASVGSGWGRTATDEELKKDLPKLYVYDHCPFCVRCRMIFGLKEEKHNLMFLANDDAVTPTKMIGKKVLPILEFGGEAMGESLDIVKKVEGDNPMLKPSTNRKDIKAWMDENSDLQRKLVRPRTAWTPLAEFQTKNSRQTYEDNHPLPDGTSYADCMKQTPDLLQKFNAALKKLDNLIYSEESVSEGGVGYDDIELWPRLRGFTIIKGVDMPPKLKAYVENMADKTDVPLFYYCAS